MEDVYHLLQYHWVKNEYSFANEQQRLYVSTGILMAAYLGCRPVSMFNTETILKDTREDPLFAPNLVENEEIGILSDEDMMDTDEESDVPTDEENNSGHDETRCLLWRHVELWIVPNEDSTKPNVLFVKIGLLHTKGEGRNPRR